MEKRHRRHFTDEFKADTVKLVLQEGKPVAQVARDLDLTESAIRQWVKQAKIDSGKGPAGALTTAEKEELAQLFRSFTADLKALGDWLVGCAITTVAMESTGIYWVPVFEMLEARGLDVVLVNARDAKTVPGRKTDVNDAQWIQQLHSYGLLRASFRPGAAIVALRAYLRHRERMLEYAAAHVQHMQKALMQMNLQLHHVVSDITGVTGMKIVRAIIAGERDPKALAAHRDVRCKASAATISEALTGHYRPEHVFALGRRSSCMTPTRQRCRTATPRSSAACAHCRWALMYRRPPHLRPARDPRRTSRASRSGPSCIRCSAST
jgi:transposase-like protein